MRCIDADAIQYHWYIATTKDGKQEHTRIADMDDIDAMPTIEPEPVWHECFDEDLNSFPDDSRNVLVSFSNFSLSIIGQWRVDEDGSGCWYLGDTDETFLSEDLYVDGWWELPKKPERSN